MSTISIDIPAKSFAICILEGIFTSTVYDPVRPEEISMSRGCSATVLLDLREAKKMADKVDRLIPKLNTGYSQQFRKTRGELVRKIRAIEISEAPIKKTIDKPETTPPAWMLEIDPDL
jgi:hypothetical protein